MTTEIAAALNALEQLSSSSATSSSGPLNALLDTHFAQAKDRILAGDNPKAVITDLQKDVIKAKKGVEKGLKAWYAGLGNVGKAVDSVSLSDHDPHVIGSWVKGFPPALGAISAAYDNPLLFSEAQSKEALNRAVLDSMVRRGMWDGVAAFEEETGIQCDPSDRQLAEQLHLITRSIEDGNVDPALQ